MSDNARKQYTTPHQRLVLVHRDMPKKDKQYVSIYVENLQAAASDLKHGSLKVYLYLLANRDKYTLAFSPKDIGDKYNVSEDTVRAAFKELVEKGYLIQTDHQKNLYEFFEVAQEVEETKQILVYGKRYPMTYNQILKGCHGDKAEADKVWMKGEIE